MISTQHQVFTIGHSNHGPETFLALLQGHSVKEVFDVRSAPYSRYMPHFNYDNLRDRLDSADISYAFLGEELGGRPKDRSFYDESGRVVYEALADSDLFDDGIRRVVRAADERRVAVMCSEKEPLDCHRSLLIGKALVERGLSVAHILADGSLEEHDATMNRLLGNYRLPLYGDLISSRGEMIDSALYRQARRVAFVAERAPGGGWGHEH